MVEKISLYELFGSNIMTRNSIKILFESVKRSKNKSIVMDFSKIGFISRSCADEYSKQKERVEKSIVEANVSDSVYNMFQNVENQYKSMDVNFSVKISPRNTILVN